MRRTLVAAAVAMLGLTAAAAPDLSFAKAHRHHVHHVANRTSATATAPARSSYAASQACRHKRNNGTVIGAVGGGVAGNLLGGHGVGGTLLGAGAGAVAGHEIARHSTGC